MSSVESESRLNKNSVIDDDDEELAQLRLAALMSRKSANKQKKPESNNEDSVPQQSSFIQTQTGTSRKFWSNRRRPISTQKPNHRSNLIVINPVALEDAAKGNEIGPYPKLVLPQHRWCVSSNEDSMSPKLLNFKKKDVSRFSRFESDSDSESDFDIPSSSSEDSHNETQDEEICEKQNPDKIQEAVPSSFDVPSPTLRDNASTVDFVESEILCSPICSETEKEYEKVNTSDFHCVYNASESSGEYTVEMCQLDYQNEKFAVEKDTMLQESANVADLQLNNQISTNSILSDHDNETNFKGLDVCIDKALLSLTSSSTEIVPKEPDPSPLKVQLASGDVDLQDFNSVTGKCEYNDPELTNGNELCNSKLFHLQRSDVNCNTEVVEQPLIKNDLRYELKKRKKKRGRRNRSDRYSDCTSCSESDSSSKSSYSDRQSDRGVSLDSGSSSDQGSSDESLSPPVKSVLSVVKPISLESSDLHHNYGGKNFHEASLSQVSKGQRDQKFSQKVEYHSSVEDMCNFHSHSSKKRRSSSSSEEKDTKKSTEDHFSDDEVPDGWCKKRLPVHMRLGVPAKRRFDEVDDSGQYSRHNKFSGKYGSANDPKKTNFRIEVSDSFDNENSADSKRRNNRSLKDEAVKKRKVTW